MEGNFVSLSLSLSLYKKTKTEASEKIKRQKKEMKGDDEGTRTIRKFTF